MPENRLPPGRTRRLAEFLAWALLFGLAYGQSPLYTSNQNQYFLHGAARAGIGDLTRDWLANTVDSVPLFSLMVEAVYRSLPAAAFYLIYLAVLGIYLYSLVDIGAHFFDLRRPATRRVFLAGLILVHSAALRFALTRLLGPAWDYGFDGGVAGQRLLGPVLQPSCFGVLLLLSVALFLRRRPYLAVTAAVAAASLHPTYLLSAATLTLAYLWILWREDHTWRTTLTLGLLSLTLVAPITLYVALALGPTSAQLSAEAQAILVDIRIPHHAQVAQWLDTTVLFKLALIAAGLGLARRTRLFPILLISLFVALGLTVLQVATDNSSLALLFPWRLSTVLVPLATGLLAAWAAARATEAILPRLGSREKLLAVASWGLAAALGLAGVGRFVIDRRQMQTDPARPMMAFVAASRRAGDLYLIPPRLQEFRLATGAAALVDFKSIPYRDVEVLAWYERERLAEWFYRDRIEYVDCGLLARFQAEYGVTHVVLDANLLELTCPAFGPTLFADEHYAVLALVSQ